MRSLRLLLFDRISEACDKAWDKVDLGFYKPLFEIRVELDG